LLKGIEEANRTLGRTEEDNVAGWQRAGSIRNCHMGEVPGAWVVENVATLPEFRRRGVVDRLLREILARARDGGAKVSKIGVFIGNDPAQRAYEKAGFAVTAEKRDPEFEAVYKSPGVRRLNRTL